jgi:hypothetical protein
MEAGQSIQKSKLDSMFGLKVQAILGEWMEWIHIITA